MAQLLVQPKWRVVDQSSLGPYFHALQSFAMDDTLCTSVGAKESDSVVRTWVHHDTIVLGVQDSRLPKIQEAINYLQSEGYEVIVRNSGGLAVVLDEGVLNISLVFPDQEKGIDIDRGYEAMLTLIQQMFAEYGKEIKAYEIVGSYCPGSFDLSIDGKKFAGISQRRIRNGVAVQIYLCVTGSGAERAKIIQRFYEIGKNEEVTKFTYPEIKPSVMASLQELFEVELTVTDVLFKLLNQMKVYTQEELYAKELTPNESLLYEEYYQRVVARNEKILG